MTLVLFFLFISPEDSYPYPMPLIVDTFETPAVLVSRKLFGSDEITELSDVSMEVVREILCGNGIYYTHMECSSDKLCSMKYYFNEVVEVLTNVRYINKNKKVVKYYSIERDGEDISLREIKECTGIDESVDKTAFLPHLRVQEEELVIFPQDED